MDDMTSYYAPPPQPPAPGSIATYTYYQAPPPPPPPTTTLSHLPPPHPLPFHPHSYAPTLIAHAAYDEVRTLFVAGLPEDVKPREIYNLFREFPGYESSHLRSRSESSQPFAFAVFVDQQSAVAAMHALNGMVFDLEKGSTLYIDLAKANSRSKRFRTDDERVGSEKRAKLSAAYSFSTADLVQINLITARAHLPEKAHNAHVLHIWAQAGVGSTHIPGMGNSAHGTNAYPSTQSYASPDGRAVNETKAAKMNNSSAPPCPTLFVANLGPGCTEQDLIQLFSKCPGFLKLKMQSTYGAPVAFVDFEDTSCSTGALNHLQGTVLYSSPSGEGIRLEYAKSRMGMRRKGKQ